MDDATLQRKLNQLERLANELDAEAKRRYGEQGFLFFEAEGAFHIMDGDDIDHGCDVRQSHIRFSTKKYCKMGAGAW